MWNNGIFASPSLFFFPPSVTHSILYLLIYYLKCVAPADQQRVLVPPERLSTRPLKYFIY